MLLPSGDQTGWRASLNRSVTRRAAPPEAGTTQMLPCKSMANHLPSGETATAMDVPSSTVIVICLGVAACAPVQLRRLRARTAPQRLDAARERKFILLVATQNTLSAGDPSRITADTFPSRSIPYPICRPARCGIWQDERAHGLPSRHTIADISIVAGVGFSRRQHQLARRKRHITRSTRSVVVLAHDAVILQQLDVKDADILLTAPVDEIPRRVALVVLFIQLGALVGELLQHRYGQVGILVGNGVVHDAAMVGADIGQVRV